MSRDHVWTKGENRKTKILDYILQDESIQEYGPPPGMESLAERRAREAREKAERERKLKEIEAKRNSKVV